MKWEKKVQNIGNSAAILIPTDLMKYLGIEIGDTVVISEDEGKHGFFGSFWKKQNDIL